MELLTFAKLAADLPINLIKSSYTKVDCSEPWERERNELVGRARWLCQEVIVPPQTLIKKMPKEPGRFYGGQWAIYSCCYTVVALGMRTMVNPQTLKTHS